MVKKIFFILITLVIVLVMPLSGQEFTHLGNKNGSIIIKWESLNASYRIQVRRDNQIFIDIEQIDNELGLNLLPGSYDYRVHVLNPFGRSVSVSDWKPLIVKSSQVPYFTLQNPQLSWESGAEISLSIKSSLLKEGTVLTLHKGAQYIPVEWEKNEDFYTVHLPGGTIESGSWELIAQNPSGMKFTYPKPLVIHPPLAIKEIQSKKQPSSTAAPDLQDPKLDGASQKKKFVMYHPRFEFQFGYAPGFLYVVYSAPSRSFTSFLPVYFGLEFAMLFQSGWEKPFFRSLGVEFRTFAGMTGPSVEDTQLRFIGSLDISAYFRPRTKGRVSPVFLIGIGNHWSDYLSLYAIQNMWLLRIGIGMDIVNVRDITRIGVNFNLLSRMIPSVSLMFRRGIRY